MVVWVALIAVILVDRVEVLREMAEQMAAKVAIPQAIWLGEEVELADILVAEVWHQVDREVAVVEERQTMVALTAQAGPQPPEEALVYWGKEQMALEVLVDPQVSEVLEEVMDP